MQTNFRAFLLLFLIGATAAVHFQWDALSRSHIYDEDLLQSPHWAAYHFDTFRADDEIVEYARFNESPVQNTIYFVGLKFFELIPLSAYLAVLSYPLVTCLFFFVGRAMYNPRTGFLMAMFFTFFPDQFKYSSGFFSKFWAMPLLLLCLYLLHSRRWRWLMLLLPFAAVAYPVTAFLIGLTCGVYLLMLLFTDRREAWALFRPLAIGSVLAVALLGSKYFTIPEFIGPMAPRAQLLVDLQGVSKYVPIPSLPWELLTRSGHPFFIASAVLFLLLLGPRLFRWDRTWTAMLIAAAVGYLLADMFFARLYIPNRYTRNAIAVLMVLWSATNWDRILDRIPRPAWRWATVAALFLAAGWSFNSLERGEWVWNDRRYRKLGAFIQTLPESSLIAGPPRYLDRVMLLGRRSVLVPFLLDHAWYTRRHEEFRQRTLDINRAIYASRVESINELHERYGVTHLLLSWRFFRERLEAGKFASRHNEEIKAKIVGNRRRFVLKSMPEDWIIFDDGLYVMVELPLPDPPDLDYCE